MQKFREHAPSRKCKVKFTDYRRYKEFLQNDFNHRCGYTDAPDIWFGGKNAFHIDHFVPWKNHPTKPFLKTDYNNLVYCCSYVNILKSNDEGNYLDPCDNDLNEHFYRDAYGHIFPRKDSPQAIYMYHKLQLGMERYAIIWSLSSLYEKMERLKFAINKIPDGNKKNKALKIMGELAMEFIDYLKYLSLKQ